MSKEILQPVKKFLYGLKRLSEEMIANPDEAEASFVRFREKVLDVFGLTPQDHYGMLCFPGVVLRLSGDDIRRQGGEVVVEGKSPSSLVRDRWYEVVDPKLVGNGGRVVSPLVVKPVEEINGNKIVIVRFPSSEDVFKFLKNRTGRE